MHVGEVAVARSRRAEGGSERRGGRVIRAGAHTTLAVVMMLACQAVTRVAGQDSHVEHGTYSNDSCRWAHNLLPGSGSAKATAAAFAARSAVVVTHVRATLRTTVRSISP